MRAMATRPKKTLQALCLVRHDPWKVESVVVQSPAFPMRLRSVLALLAVPPALLFGGSLLGVGCVAFPFGSSGVDTVSSGGVGGAPFDNESTGTGTGSGFSSGEGGSTSFTTSTSTGTGILLGDAGTPSYKNLCGGDHPACEPGKLTDTCAQGGNPGVGGGPSASDAGAVSCQLVPSDGGAGGGGGSALTAQCGASGTAGDGDPCMTSADCGPEMGCIAGVTPICRAYCCESLESCPAETYCVTAQMNEAPSSAIPICIPAQNCELLNDATCPAGLTCAIVRATGTTSCVVPGSGTTGEACPCAAGFTCSSADNTCLQLCHAGSTTDCGSNGFCQGGTAPYPDGIGYCVSY
jgi:hypothetical protein